MTVPDRVRRVLLAGAVFLLFRGVVGLAGWFYLVAATERLKAELKQAQTSLAEPALPVLSGSPQACNAADRYALVLIELARTRQGRGLTQETDHGTDTASPLFLARLQESAQCAVCDWRPGGDVAYAEDETLLHEGVRLVSSQLLAVDDRLVAAARGGEAFAALVEVLRFSECVATGPPGMRAHGERLADQAIGALTRLVAEGRLASRDSLAQLASHLDVLEGRLPSVVEGARVESLELAVGLAQAHRERGGRGSLEGWLPRHAIAAYRFRHDEALIRQMIDAVDTCELDSLRQMTESIGLGVKRSGSEWLSKGLPSFYTWRVVHEYLVARYRILRTAIDLELMRLRTGSYPDDLSAEVLRPGRCSGLQKFHYERRGSGYRLWSAGLRGLDGQSDSKGGALVLEVPVVRNRS